MGYVDVARLQEEVARLRGQAVKVRSFVFLVKVCLVCGALVLFGMSVGYVVAVHKFGAGCAFSGFTGGVQY
jgi:ABC-type Fe3+-siderophore transport system permease subunit